MAYQLCQFSSLPALILDHEGRILQYNRAFIQYWDIDPSKLISSPGYRIFEDPFFRRQGQRLELQKAFEGAPVKFQPENYYFPREFRRSKAPVEARKISLLAIPFTMAEGSATVAIFYCADPADSASGDMEKGCERVAELASTFKELQHEISNPLLLIIGHTQLLLAKSDRLPAEVARKLEKILNNAEKIRHLLVARKEAIDWLALDEGSTPVEV
jgi:nitrogen-specific signal transduction histidine kinase